jgi:glycosyltransferase involved in cell wall biosynthesis
MNTNEQHNVSQAFAQRPRVLLLAYACSPYRGSEFTVGWGRALETAKRYETWVICGPESEPDINRYLAENGPLQQLHFCFPESEQDRNPLRRLPALYAHNYIAMWFWHRRAYRLAARLHRELKFDLAHQVNITGFREPGYLWRLDAPFLWGPLSGTQNLPWRFLPALGLTGAVKEAVRGMVNLAQLYGGWRVRKASRRASAVIAANSQIQREFARAQGISPRLLLETGLHQVKETSERKSPAAGTLRLLWCGELKAFKGLPLLLEALAQLPPEIRYELRVIGKGPMLRKWQSLAESNGIGERCHWQGFIPYTEVLREYDQADLFVFTSLRDTSGNVMLEALSRGVPVIGPAHQGAGDIITPECGIRIPVTTPREFIAGLRDAVAELAINRRKLEELSRGALGRASFYLWSRNGERMDEIYRQVLAESDQPHQVSALGGKVVSDVIHAQ